MGKSEVPIDQLIAFHGSLADEINHEDTELLASRDRMIGAPPLARLGQALAEAELRGKKTIFHSFSAFIVAQAAEVAGQLEPHQFSDPDEV